MTDGVAVWWLTQEDCEALGTPMEVEGMGLPDYLKRAYSSRYGRPGRGRLWGLDARIEPGPDTPIAKLAKRGGGIVFNRRDIAAVFPLPGLVTDLALNKIAP